MMIECDKVKNNKGQALVEFIIILPIFLLLLISTIDFGNIYIKKMSLENDLDLVYDLYKDKEYTKINDYITSKDISVTYEEVDDFTNIKLEKDINVFSPVLVSILGKDYKVEVERTLYNKG